MPPRSKRRGTLFGERLRTARESLALKRHELAALAGVTLETIRNFELGYTKVTRPAAMAILRALADYDLARALHVAEALESPATALEQLRLALEQVEPPGPLHALLKVDAAKNVSFEVDAVAIGQLIAYAARRAREDRDRPGGGVVVLIISLAQSKDPTDKPN